MSLPHTTAAHLLAATCIAAALPARAVGQSPSPTALPFRSVQTELFATPNSFSNAWGDYDNDGDLDLAVSLGSGEVRLYRNDKGVLVSVGAQMGMPQAGSHELRGLSWGDYDRDGFIDLLGGATAKDKVTLVLRSERGRHFTDVAPAIGLAITGRSSRQTNWVDYDNDGDLDVYATDRAGDNRLFRNDGGHFRHVFVGVGPTDARPTVGSCWFDFDRDGDLDVFLANQAGATDALWRNDGGTFTDVAAAAGVAGPTRTTAEGGVGCAVGDYDNDGDFDLFVANYGHNQLYRNNDNGTFTDVAASLGITNENHAVSADFGDYDNDGDLDLSVISYAGASGAQTPLNALYRNDGSAGFVNVLTKDSPLNVADHSVQFVDFDGDGALDLSVTDGYGPVGGHFLFRNTLPDADKRRSLSVLVLDANGHQTRFGAEVRVYDRAGALLGSRLVVAGGGYDAQRAAPVHVGLARRGRVTVEVTFMSRDGRRTQSVRHVEPSRYRGRSLVIRERP
ncbi:MAG: CRTAC1 family protein [Gemmatimonadetes bacterium]|nr:CRTAC1 family protein [Gemmatimonadota bacterium]